MNFCCWVSISLTNYRKVHAHAHHHDLIFSWISVDDWQVDRNCGILSRTEALLFNTDFSWDILGRLKIFYFQHLRLALEKFSSYTIYCYGYVIKIQNNLISIKLAHVGLSNLSFLYLEDGLVGCCADCVLIVGAQLNLKLS